jgi:hypothetical protein
MNRGSGAPVVYQLTRSASEPDQPGGILSVSIRMSADRVLDFTPAMSEDAEAVLVARELEVLQVDHGYEAALQGVIDD